MNGIGNPYTYTYQFSSPLNLTGAVDGFASIVGMRSGQTLFSHQYVLDLKVDIVNTTQSNTIVSIYSIRNTQITNLVYFNLYVTIYNKDLFGLANDADIIYQSFS